MIEQNGTWETRTADADDAGQRLDKWLSSWTELSRSRIRDLVETGNVRADGDIVAKVTTKIRPEIEYAVHVPPPVDDTPKAENIPLDILFEDDYLIVLNKSSGMTVHPAPGSRSATLVNALLFHCADSLSGIGGVMRPGIVHRLDKDTSGVMVVAKTDRAHQGLSKQFAKHSIDRIYTCLVRGAPKPRSGRVASRLARSPNDRKKQAVVRGTFDNIEASDVGRHAVTHLAPQKSANWIASWKQAEHIKFAYTYHILVARFWAIRFTANNAPMRLLISPPRKPFASPSPILNAKPSTPATWDSFTPSQKSTIVSMPPSQMICSTY